MPTFQEKLRLWISNISVPYAVLSVVAIYSVIKNLYGYFTTETKTGARPSGGPSMGGSGLSSDMKNLLWERLSSWGGVTVIVLIVALILRYYNNKYEDEQERQAEFEEQVNEEAERVQQERKNQQGCKKGQGKQDSTKGKTKANNEKGKKQK